LRGLLAAIYWALENFEPKTYTLSPEAKALYRDWFNRLDARRISETQQGLRAVFGKMKGDTGVLALLLHCINAAIAGRMPAAEVSGQTMRSAIQLANYYLNQVRVIHAEGDSEGTLEDSCSRIIKISQRKGWISARDVHQADRAIRKRLPAESVRSLFRELEAMGLGETSGEGVHLEFRAYFVDAPVDDLLTPLTVDEATAHCATEHGPPPEIMTPSTLPIKFELSRQQQDTAKVQTF
jgi:CRISPR-associated protein Cmr3